MRSQSTLAPTGEAAPHTRVYVRVGNTSTRLERSRKRSSLPVRSRLCCVDDVGFSNRFAGSDERDTRYKAECAKKNMTQCLSVRVPGVMRRRSCRGNRGLFIRYTFPRQLVGNNKVKEVFAEVQSCRNKYKRHKTNVFMKHPEYKQRHSTVYIKTIKQLDPAPNDSLIKSGCSQQ